MGTLQLAACMWFSRTSENSVTAAGPYWVDNAFDACTDADVNHAGLDSIRDIDAGLEAARALSVESLDGG